MTHVIMKAKNATTKVAVYDENGRLIGLVDPEDLEPVQTAAPGPATAGPTAQPTEQQIGQAAQTVSANMEKALAGVRPKPGLVRKSGKVPVASGFADLVKSLDAAAADRLRAAVGLSAAMLMTTGVPSKEAVTIARSAAIRHAIGHGLF